MKEPSTPETQPVTRYYLASDPPRIDPPFSQVDSFWPRALQDAAAAPLPWQDGDCLYVSQECPHGPMVLPNGTTVQITDWAMIAVLVRRGDKWHSLLPNLEWRRSPSSVPT